MQSTFQIRFSTFLLAFLTLFSCASKPKEQYDDSFFTFESPDGKPSFTFVLKLKNRMHGYEDVLFERVNGKVSQKRISLDGVPRPDNPEDASVSLKYRMEVKAHEKLKLKLEAVEFCAEKVVYESEEYADYQYKIKGYCPS